MKIVDYFDPSAPVVLDIPTEIYDSLIVQTSRFQPAPKSADPGPVIDPVLAEGTVAPEAPQMSQPRIGDAIIQAAPEPAEFPPPPVDTTSA